ncbi:MAG: ABC transporter ATP-binding protein [Myxococcales bacterium]|nr:ABC transporter ATP-binding protein [Myxococcales bacterium]
MIEVERLCKRYGDFDAVRDLSFTVEPAEVMGFLGPNGAGKTTTLRILAGFIGATSGRVRIAGHDVASARDAARTAVGYMPESCPLYPEMRVAEYLRYRAELKRVPRGRRRGEVGSAMEATQIADVADLRIGLLSKGYRQRVGLADALLGAPPLLILDEPTSGLDPNQIREVRALIKQLGAKHTVLISSHILSEIEASCSRVLILARGELVAAGTLAEIRARGGRPVVEVWLGDGVERARRALAALDCVREVRDAPPPELGGACLEVHARSADPEALVAAAEHIARALHEAGVPLRRLAPVVASLEEVFHELTLAAADAAEDAA